MWGHSSKTFFMDVILIFFCKKLVYLSLARLSSLVKCLQVRAESTRVKHLKGALLYVRLLLSLSNLVESNTLAYWDRL